MLQWSPCNTTGQMVINHWVLFSFAPIFFFGHTHTHLITWLNHTFTQHNPFGSAVRPRATRFGSQTMGFCYCYHMLSILAVLYVKYICSWIGLYINQQIEVAASHIVMLGDGSPNSWRRGRIRLKSSDAYGAGQGLREHLCSIPGMAEINWL